MKDGFTLRVYLGEKSITDITYIQHKIHAKHTRPLTNMVYKYNMLLEIKQAHDFVKTFCTKIEDLCALLLYSNNLFLDENQSAF